MRILYATRDFPPEGWAGTEVYTSTLAVGFRDLGHDVHVVCVGRWAEGARHFNGASRGSYRGVPVTRFHLNWVRAPDPTGYLYRNPVVAGLFQQEVQEFKPDVVHVTSCDRLSASVIAAAQSMGVPVALSLTDFWFLCPRINLVRWDGGLCDGDTSAWECLRCMMAGTKVYRGLAALPARRSVEPVLTWISQHPMLTRWRGLRGLAVDMADRKQYLAGVLRDAEHVMMATEFGCRLFQAFVPDQEIHLVAYGHDLSWLAEYGGKTPSERLRIGYVGRLDESKGPHVLIQAFRELPADSPATLAIHGQLPENDFGRALQAMAAGDPRIRFCGTHAHEESDRVFENLDVVVIPSLWYDFPLVAHEALATGTVVVATDMPGLNEIITDQVTGLLFERGNVPMLAAKLGSLVDSPDLVGQLSGNRRPVKSVQEAMVELHGIYRGIAEAVA